MEALYQKFLEVAASRDEAAMEAFLRDHINEFPEDLQEKILFEYFQQALADQDAQTRAMLHIKEEGLAALDQSERVTKAYRDAQRLDSVRKDLGI